MKLNDKLVSLGKKWVRWYFSKIDYSLKHHGVKGQKWGVKNGPPYPIKRDGVFRNPKSINLTTVNGFKVTGFSQHVEDEINAKDDRKVTLSDIYDAIENPLHINEITTDSEGRKSQRFIGEYATINVNPETGVLSTLWKTGTRIKKKYKKG